MNEKQFTIAIKKDPYDSDTRKVFADYLEDHDRPEEADFQRYCAREEWKEARRWMEDFASRCGQHCVNYDEYCESHFRGDRTMKEVLVPITFDMVMKVGRDVVDSYKQAVDANKEHPEWYVDRFVQLGSETARNLMQDEETRKKFWECWQTIIRESLEEGIKDCSPFSCSC